VIRQCQDRLVQLQRSHTPSNTPSSYIHTTSWSTTQPVSIPPHAPRSHVPHSIQLPLHNAADNQGLTQDKFVTTPLSPSNHKHLPPYTYNLILCDPSGVDPLTYALPPQCPPWYPCTHTHFRTRKHTHSCIQTQTHKHCVCITTINTVMRWRQEVTV